MLVCGFGTRPGYQVLKRPPSETKKIFGTWDFKWPQGRTIHVAFQRLSKDDEKAAKITFDEVVQKVIRYANTWPAEYEKLYGEPSPLKFEFSDKYFAPPVATANGGRSKVDSTSIVDYDVLVSVSPLPFPLSYEARRSVPAKTLPPSGKPRPWPTTKIDKTPTGAPLMVHIPTSELGRFATRCDYGVPTVYVGRPKRVRQPGDATQKEAKKLGPRIEVAVSTLCTDKDLAEYFGPANGVSSSREFEATIVHEFGHVLGLPHLHQSPLDRPRWRSLDELRDIVAVAAHVDIDDDALRSQMTLPFPSTRSARGEVLYSDWGPVPRDANGDPVFDSAMNHPLLQLMIQPAKDDDPEPKIERPLAPTKLDLEFLNRMYT